MPREFYAFSAIATVASLGLALFTDTPNLLLWNRTQSAPIGLYRVLDSSVVVGDWAVVAADAASTRWIAEHGYLEPGWPIIKRVAGVYGDEICRAGGEIFINGLKHASALVADPSGQNLPTWQGCRVLTKGEIFLLSNHPLSLDGRYFSVTRTDELDGRAVLIWRRQTTAKR